MSPQHLFDVPPYFDPIYWERNKNKEIVSHHSAQRAPFPAGPGYRLPFHLAHPQTQTHPIPVHAKNDLSHTRTRSFRACEIDDPRRVGSFLANPLSTPQCLPLSMRPHLDTFRSHIQSHKNRRIWCFRKLVVWRRVVGGGETKNGCICNNLRWRNRNLRAIGKLGGPVERSERVFGAFFCIVFFWEFWVSFGGLRIKKKKSGGWIVERKCGIHSSGVVGFGCGFGLCWGELGLSVLGYVELSWVGVECCGVVWFVRSRCFWRGFGWFLRFWIKKNWEVEWWNGKVGFLRLE